MINGDLKITDFRFAASVQGRDGTGYHHTYLESPNYIPPEIHCEEPYIGEHADLFASAVILFLAIAGVLPFTTAQAKDKQYKSLVAKPELFWKNHCNNIENPNIHTDYFS